MTAEGVDGQAGSNENTPPWSSRRAVRFQWPSVPPLEQVSKYFAASEAYHWFSNFGPCHEQLALALADWIGGGVSCVPVANCTVGLMAALRVAFGEPARRRKVLLPAYTFAASACAVVWSGFDPVFMDVDEVFWQVRPDHLGLALRDLRADLAGVMLTSTFGTPAPASWRADWMRICSDAGIPLVIDSAAGFGARDETLTALGQLGVLEVFSFHATKPFAVGEGGVIACPDSELARRLRSIINFGFDESQLVSGPIGLNGKMSDLTAAVGLAALDRLPSELESRRALATRYRIGLEELGVRFQGSCDIGTWQAVNVQMPDPEARERWRVRADADGIEYRCLFSTPLHVHPGFAHCGRVGSLEVTDKLAERALSLPMASDLDERDVDAVVGSVERSLTT